MTDELMNWYNLNARDLPWRGIHDAYRTWVSEIMLQQTRVDTVIPYYHAFLDHFPDIASLASASRDEVLKQWEGLGYYSRAVNLHEGAKQVLKQYNGVVPSDPGLLTGIHGIGRYTAGAIASIAYNQPVTAVDGNVIRVFTRFFGIEKDTTLPSTLAEIDTLDFQCMDKHRPGDYNQALMDLGATVCVPGTPDCDRCPLHENCTAFAGGHPEDLPHQPNKKAPRQIDYDLFLITDGSSVLMHQRTEKMLHGLWVFPMSDSHHKQNEITAFIRKKWKVNPVSSSLLCTAKHVFTHQIWQMNVYLISVETCYSEALTSLPVNELTNYALPTAMRIPRQMLLKYCAENNKKA